MHKRAMALSRSAGLALAAAALALMPGIVHALGLGKLTVYSALNEPLQAEIPFTSISDRELKTLTVSLRAPRDFRATSIEPSPLFNRIDVELVQRAGGYSLALRSQHRIREPFLRILLEVEWAGGRLIREFTPLINPPQLIANDPSQTRFTAQPVVPPTPRETVKQLSGVNESAAIDTQTTRPDSKAASASSRGAAKNATPAPDAETVARQASTDKRDVSKGKEEELADRIRALESQIKTLHGLLQLKSKTLTETQKPREQDYSGRADIDSEKVPPDSQIGKPSSQISPRAHAESKSKTQTRDPVSTRLASQAEPSRFGERQLLMVAVALVAGLIFIVGAFMVFMYVRRRQALAAVGGAVDAPRPEPVLHDRRSGRGRRRRFVPVPFERRRGPRRSRDRLTGEVGHMHTEKANTVDETETYLACGHHEHAEKALRDAIAREPDRHALKVKLLALYQQRHDDGAFEDLVNALYAALEVGEPLDQGEPNEADVDATTGADGVLDEGDGENLTRDHDLSPLDAKTPVDGSNPDETALPPYRSNDGDDDEPMGPLHVDSPTDDKGELERELEALAMSVPKARDESTRRILSDLPADRNDEPHGSDGDQDSAHQGIAALEVDDLVDIKQAVARGMDVLESSVSGNNDKNENDTVDKGDALAKSGLRSGRGNRKAKRRNPQSQDAKQEQWRNPATKIDLAKAYIDMGDAERARNLLDEVLESWDRGDGTGG